MKHGIIFIRFVVMFLFLMLGGFLLISCVKNKCEYVGILIGCLFFSITIILPVYICAEISFIEPENDIRNKKLDDLLKIREKLATPTNVLEKVEDTVINKNSEKVSTSKNKNFNYELYVKVIDAIVEI